MPFPVSPNPGDSYTDAYGTVWIYAGSVNGWYRQEVIPGNETTYTGGGSGSATATGAAGEIQFTDGTNLDASPNLVWDDANDELEVTGDLKLLDGGSWTTTLQTITPTQDNTISLPNATGTVALVAGSSGQPVYNNAGAYAGLSTATIGTTGNITLSLNGAASTPPVSFTGTWFTGGTATTTKPQLLIEPSGTTSTAWSTSGTGLGVNAASGFGGNLLDLQVNGTRALAVKNDGGITAKTDVVWNRTNGNSLFYVGTNAFGIYNTSQTNYWFSASGVELTSSFYYGWASGTAGSSSADLTLYRDAANTLAQRNGTNAQTFRVYGTESSSLANHVRASLSCSSTAVTLAAESAGTGAANVPINLTAKGTGTVKVNSVAEVAVSSTVAGLPAAPAVGMLTRVTDATAPAVGSTVTGGGAAAALVWYNGTNWTVIGV